jgi:vacuolar protein sorting-associated protein 45
LALLYIIRYESYNESAELKNALMDLGVKPNDVALLDAMVQYAGEARRAPGLFSTGSLIAKIGKTFTTSLTGIENVYTQHVPLLDRILDSIVKGKLKDSQFPSAAAVANNSKPNEVLVFMVGGVTYEEALKVSEFNTNNPSMRIILGGSCIQNSVSFLKELNSSFGLA